MADREPLIDPSSTLHRPNFVSRCSSSRLLVARRDSRIREEPLAKFLPFVRSLCVSLIQPDQSLNVLPYLHSGTNFTSS